MRSAAGLWRAGLVALGAALLVLSGCSTVSQVRLFSVTVKVVDDKDQAIKGAIVETSEGQKTSTDAAGAAQIKLGVAGAHLLTVAAEGRAPATLSVTMPLDMNKTFTARLGPPVSISAGISVNLGGNLMGAMMAQLYPMMFQALFAAHGYNLDLVPMNPGQWTEWRVSTQGERDPMVMRKAFLTVLGSGQEWWQLQVLDKDEDGNITMEVMFSKGRESLRRMRQKTGKEAPSEVPVTEGWYTPPMRLTKESLEGAIVKRGVSVKVPAGTFKADQLEFAALGVGGKVRMWRAGGVPGGVVKAEMVEADGQIAWSSELTSKGASAKSLLGSF